MMPVEKINFVFGHCLDSNMDQRLGRLKGRNSISVPDLDVIYFYLLSVKPHVGTFINAEWLLRFSKAKDKSLEHNRIQEK